MESEIKGAWIQGYVRCLHEFTAIGDWDWCQKLASESWRDACENLTFIGSLTVAGPALLAA
jgi:hypothetical protein